jgi:hypothetical protein
MANRREQDRRADPDFNEDDDRELRQSKHRKRCPFSQKGRRRQNPRLDARRFARRRRDEARQ